MTLISLHKKYSIVCFHIKKTINLDESVLLWVQIILTFLNERQVIQELPIEEDTADEDLIIWLLAFYQLGWDFKYLICNTKLQSGGTHSILRNNQKFHIKGINVGEIYEARRIIVESILKECSYSCIKALSLLSLGDLYDTFNPIIKESISDFYVPKKVLDKIIQCNDYPLTRSIIQVYLWIKKEINMLFCSCKGV